MEYDFTVGGGHFIDGDGKSQWPDYMTIRVSRDNIADMIADLAEALHRNEDYRDSVFGRLFIVEPTDVSGNVYKIDDCLPPRCIRCKWCRLGGHNEVKGITYVQGCCVRHAPVDGFTTVDPNKTFCGDFKSKSFAEFAEVVGSSLLPSDKWEEIYNRS